MGPVSSDEQYILGIGRHASRQVESHDIIATHLFRSARTPRGSIDVEETGDGLTMDDMHFFTVRIFRI